MQKNHEKPANGILAEFSFQWKNSRAKLEFRFSTRASAAAVFDDEAVLICGPMEESDVSIFLILREDT